MKKFITEELYIEMYDTTRDIDQKRMIELSNMFQKENKWLIEILSFV